MPKQSAGILLYRYFNKQLQFLLVHPGGPFWAKKDIGAWSIPKGEFDGEENALDAAIREMEEETSVKVAGDFIELSPVREKSGKVIHAFALEMDVDVTNIESNTFEMEWPPRSGKKKVIPEVDKAGWFDMETASVKIVPGQLPLLEQLRALL
jgi:predicted NUDIX family NTP pyrophosphohydrolase